MLFQLLLLLSYTYAIIVTCLGTFHTMIEERIKTGTETYNGLSESEKIREVLIWSDYTPEIALMIHSPHGARKGVLTPLPKNLWI